MINKKRQGNSAKKRPTVTFGPPLVPQPKKPTVTFGQPFVPAHSEKQYSNPSVPASYRPYQEVLDELPDNIPKCFREQAELASKIFHSLDIGQTPRDKNGKDLSDLVDDFLEVFMGTGFIGVSRIKGSEGYLKTTYPSWVESRFTQSQVWSEQDGKRVIDLFVGEESSPGYLRKQCMGTIVDGYTYYQFDETKGANPDMPGRVYKRKAYIENRELLNFYAVTKFLEELSGLNIHPNQMKIADSNSSLVMYWSGLKDDEIEKVKAVYRNAGIKIRGPAEDPQKIVEDDKNNKLKMADHTSNDGSLGAWGRTPVWIGEYDTKEFFKRWLSCTFAGHKNPSAPYRTSFITADVDPGRIDELRQFDTNGMSIVIGNTNGTRRYNLFDKKYSSGIKATLE